MSQSYEVIFENNRKWQETKRQQCPDYFKELADGQNPEYLYIGCSDSRAAAEELMGFEPGDVFVHRNVANLVHGLDMNVASAIEYAVSHLKANTSSSVATTTAAASKRRCCPKIWAR